MNALVHLAPPSFSPPFLRACCAVVKSLAGYVASNNKVHLQVTQRGTKKQAGNWLGERKKKQRWRERKRERERERERERKYQRALRMSLEKSEIMQRQRSKDIAFPPGNHPGYQVEVIML